VLFFRPKADEDEEEFASQFEADLANMDSEDIDHEVLLGDGPENQQNNQKWSRPCMPFLDPDHDAVVFQQIDVDHYNGQPMAGMPGSRVSFVSLPLMTFIIYASINCICR
jgi:DNA polymerase delta subunit 1